jgi:hypothetical protein
MLHSLLSLSLMWAAQAPAADPAPAPPPAEAAPAPAPAEAAPAPAPAEAAPAPAPDETKPAKTKDKDDVEPVNTSDTGSPGKAFGLGMAAGCVGIFCSAIPLGFFGGLCGWFPIIGWGYLLSIPFLTALSGALLAEVAVNKFANRRFGILIAAGGAAGVLYGLGLVSILLQVGIIIGGTVVANIIKVSPLAIVGYVGANVVGIILSITALLGASAVIGAIAAFTGRGFVEGEEGISMDWISPKEADVDDGGERRSKKRRSRDDDDDD